MEEKKRGIIGGREWRDGKSGKELGRKGEGNRIVYIYLK